MPRFQIEDTFLSAELDPRSGDTGFTVASTPRPYRVDWVSDAPVINVLKRLILEAKHPLLLIDRNVRRLHLGLEAGFENTPTLEVVSDERFKTIDGALEVCSFLDDNGATKVSTLFVVGGGIVQDVAGFAACIYKRGIPWVYLPSTFLAQSDSGMGSKAGLNYNGAKNILALFSAPRRVVIHSGFLSTLEDQDVLSGLGECFRLCATGGPEFLSAFQWHLGRYFRGEQASLGDLLVCALAVKRAVIEHDEFELNERRAMNYGHSLGHALEALTSNEIPHGTAVVIGMLIENEISITEGLLPSQVADEMSKIARSLIAPRFIDSLRSTNLAEVVPVLCRDKKSEGRELKLALMHQPGLIRFHNFVLDESATRTVQNAVHRVLARLSTSAQAA